jgi:hypothetical protein
MAEIQKDIVLGIELNAAQTKIQILEDILHIEKTNEFFNIDIVNSKIDILTELLTSEKAKLLYIQNKEKEVDFGTSLNTVDTVNTKNELLKLIIPLEMEKELLIKFHKIKENELEFYLKKVKLKVKELEDLILPDKDKINEYHTKFAKIKNEYIRKSPSSNYWQNVVFPTLSLQEFSASTEVKQGLLRQFFI